MELGAHPRAQIYIGQQENSAILPLVRMERA